MGKRPPNRKHYEGELANLLKVSMGSCHVTTSGNNQGWDVTMFRHNTQAAWNKVVLIEVKTSVKPLIYLAGGGSRVRKQRAHYRKLWVKKRIVTWYAYRIMVGRHKKIQDKWTFFHINDVGSKIVWDEGIPYDEFLRVIK